MTDRFTDRFNVFQTDLEIDSSDTDKPAKRSAFGFLGKVMEGAGIVALTLCLAIITLTTAARAESLFEAGATASAAASPTGPLIGLALVAVFAIMLAMVRRTWRQTTKAIATAPNRSSRID